jgi:hypothetical protein
MASKLQFLHGMATLLLASNGLWMTTEFIVNLPHKPLVDVDVLLASFFLGGGGGGGKKKKKQLQRKTPITCQFGLIRWKHYCP